MKAKLKPHKLLSMLLALVMVVGMLPAMGQVAYAYSAGDIAGTTGSGASEADPVVCDTFAEFKAAMESSEITYVKLKGVQETIPERFIWCCDRTNFPENIDCGGNKHICRPIER